MNVLRRGREGGRREGERERGEREGGEGGRGWEREKERGRVFVFVCDCLLSCYCINHVHIHATYDSLSLLFAFTSQANFKGCGPNLPTIPLVY